MNKVVAGVMLVIVIGAVLFTYFFMFDSDTEIENTQSETFEGGKVNINIGAASEATGGDNAEESANQ
ncbi:hypothetical protein HN777_01530 [Candidatus Woesearchaeota archaeon]|jgi:hypothetical protein|nr:hypothetical protein [Candidatus Woesearchaeota archaeon]MBT7402454.1 hypothetical protein [Candidatus Woesearchaeota archaeon]